MENEEEKGRMRRKRRRRKSRRERRTGGEREGEGLKHRKGNDANARDDSDGESRLPKTPRRSLQVDAPSDEGTSVRLKSGSAGLAGHQCWRPHHELEELDQSAVSPRMPTSHAPVQDQAVQEEPERALLEAPPRAPGD